MATYNDINSALFANSGDNASSANLQKLQTRVAQRSVAWQNDDTPLAEAQRRSDMMMAAKQRRPMVFEWMQAKDAWTFITLYINPSRLSMQTQKIKSKAITRGGIFYHHWGDDHWTLTLSGTTGLSAMKGIESLEKAYHASGTLLRYKNYGPTTTNVTAGEYQVIDYNDAVGVLNNALMANPTTLGNMIQQYGDERLDTFRAKNNLVKKMLENIRNTKDGANFDKQCEAAKSELSAWSKTFQDSNHRKPNSSENYNEGIRAFKKHLSKTIEPDLIVTLAYEYAINNMTNKDDIYSLTYAASSQASSGGYIDTEFNKFLSKLGAKEVPWEQQSEFMMDNLQSRAVEINTLRAEALKKQLNKIADWEERERQIQTQLKTTALTTMADMFNDEWAPRRLILYYENRAYIGHFESFSYQRVAETPLINYDLRFVVEKQIVGQVL